MKVIQRLHKNLLAFSGRIRSAWLLVLVVASAGYAAFWYSRAPDTPPGVTVEARPAPEVAKEATAPLQIEFVKVFGPEVKKKLKLPTPVQIDDTQHVVASTRTPSDERSHTVTTVLDTTTGDFISYDRAEPLPWVSVNTRSQAGVFYGIKSGAPVLRLQVQQEFLQVKAVHLGVVGTVDSDASFFVGAGAWMRW